MNEHSHIERLYTFLEESSETLKPYTQKSALKAFVETLNFLLDDAVEMPLPEETLEILSRLKAEVSGEPFSKTAMRKACQLMLLKAFKEERFSNAMMTPDTMGLLFGYLIEKLYDAPPETILDPMVGTGNLLASLPQAMTGETHMVGVDDDPLMVEVANNLLDALEIPHEVFAQETLTYESGTYPCIVCDFPIHKKDSNQSYLPYQVLLFHVLKLTPGGFFFALIENDFFDQPERAIFQEKVLKVAHLYGLIKLDEGMFKLHPKSVLILRRKTHEQEKIDDFLIADLPPFQDQAAFAQTLQRLEQWFAQRKG